MAKLRPHRRLRSSSSSRCCGGVSIFFLLTSLVYMLLFYRLRLCRDCDPSTWLESVILLEEAAANFNISNVLSIDEENLVSQDGQIEQANEDDDFEQENQRDNNIEQETEPESIEQESQPGSIQPDIQTETVEPDIQSENSIEELQPGDEETEETPDNAETEEELENKSSLERSKPFNIAMNSSVDYNSTSVRQWVFRPKLWRPVPESYLLTPFPVFVASLPKSGTTSLSNYFMCGGVRTVHTFCPFFVDNKRGEVRIGALIEENIKTGAPPFEGCGKGFRPGQGPINAYTDTGYADANHACYYPSISALEAMYEAYPKMTILLGTRDATQWYNSVKKWAGGSLLARWIELCSAMPDNNDPNEFIEFYEWHNRHIREFAMRHPSITFVEARIDTPTSGEELERKTNISASCWGHAIPAGVRVKSNSTTERRNSNRNKGKLRTKLSKGGKASKQGNRSNKRVRRRPKLRPVAPDERW